MNKHLELHRDVQVGLVCKRIKNFPPFVIYKRTHIIKFLKQNSSNLGILFRCFVSSV